MIPGSNTARCVIIALLTVLSTAYLPGQTSPTFSADVSVGYVMVPFVAFDKDGRTIKNLRSKDVQVVVDGKRVKTDLFERAGSAPVSFTILVDGSGSMALAGKKEAAAKAVKALIDRRLPGDDYSVHVFAAGQVQEVLSFTRNGAAVLNAIRSVKPYGTTAFYDALAAMPDKTILGENGSRAIILLTDGLDNASQLNAVELTHILQSVDVPVYPLGLRFPDVEGKTSTSVEELTDFETLAQIAAATGGRSFIGTDAEELDAAVQRIAEDLRSQYLVGFTPTGRGAVKYRAISLKLPRTVRSVRVRSGYRGTEAPMWASASGSRGGK
jgi:Ca-activated chloride channel homolog